MDTPQDQQGSYEFAEKAEKKYSDPTTDPMFFSCVNDLAFLIKKYGISVVDKVLNNYRIKYFIRKEKE